MKKIERFEDLNCWQESRALTRNVFKMTQKGALAKDWDTRSQFRRASVSVMNNIAEGFGRFTDKEKVRFLEFSNASSMEIKSMLYLFEDLGYLEKEELKFLFEQVTKTQKLILGFIRYLKNK